MTIHDTDQEKAARAWRVLSGFGSGRAFRTDQVERMERHLELITKNAMLGDESRCLDLLRAEAAEVQQLAQEVKVEISPSTDGRGYAVQHEATGMFSLVFTTPEGINEIHSHDDAATAVVGNLYKAYAIQDRFAGLGVGWKIYQAVAARWPQARWSDRVSSSGDPGALGLRRKLHASDAHRWELRGCSICDDEGGWAGLGVEDPPYGHLI